MLEQSDLTIHSFIHKMIKRWYKLAQFNHLPNAYFDKSDVLSVPQIYFENEYVEIVLKCLVVNNTFILVVPAN